MPRAKHRDRYRITHWASEHLAAVAVVSIGIGQGISLIVRHII